MLGIVNINAPQVAPQVAPTLEVLCVSKASEITGNAQTSRDELYHFFRIWVPYSDPSLSKQAAEEQDNQLRDDARMIYVKELEKSEAKVVYIDHIVVVAWKGFTAKRKVDIDGKRSAARNAFMSILHKFVSEWPIPPRPKIMPDSPLTGESSNNQDTQLSQTTLSPPKLSKASLGSLNARCRKKKLGFATQVNQTDNIDNIYNIDNIVQECIEIPSVNSDVDTYKRYAKQIGRINIKETALDKLYILFKIIHSPDAPIKHITKDLRNNCVLGFACLHVKQPEFYQRILELVNRDIWKSLSTSAKPLKNPTWVVYELFRQIGVHPVKHHRGPQEYDPGPKEFLYSVKWVFNKQTYLQNHHRLLVNGIAQGRGVEKAAAAEKAAVEEKAAAEKALELSQASNLGVLMTDYSRKSFHCFVSSSLHSLRQLKSETTVVVSEVDSKEPDIEPNANTDADADADAVVDVDADLNAAASLLELMRGPQMPECSSRKRKRKPSTGSGAQSSDVAIVAMADNNSSRSDDQDIELVSSSVIDMKGVLDDLNLAMTTEEINPNSYNRLKMLLSLLNKCQLEDLITYEIPSIKKNACILGWSKIIVKDPKQLNINIRNMVDQDQGGIWKKANGKNKQQLKNPTSGVYELFRKIGVKPRFRGPIEDDPGKHDLLYHKEWEFINDDSFKTARKRLAKGFSYCPEKGMRERKRVRKRI